MIESKKISLESYIEQYESYKNSITITKVADKETAERLRCNTGDKYTTTLIPQTKEEALERLEKYESMGAFIAMAEIFNEKYSLNTKTLQDELDTLNQFIEEAEKIKMDEATNIRNQKHSHLKNFEYEFLKLKYGHYEKKEYLDYYSFFNGITPTVKAKYFLYKDYLENEIRILEKESIKEQEFNKSIQLYFSNKTSYNNFIKYTELHIIEPYVDFSYLFQRMKSEQMILKTKQLDFINWLFENEYIKEKTKDLCLQNRGFRSLNKSSSINRENNFNNVFNL